MKLSQPAAALLAATLFVPFSAFAQSETPRVDQREARQQQRIAQGVESAALTPRETARLERGQAHVQAIETHAKSDGVVTAQERGRLARAQDRQSARIHRQKHDQ